jgi:hypothetical protein
VLPEVGDAEGAERAGESPIQTRWIVGVASHDFYSKPSESLGLFRIELAGDRARGKRTVAVGVDRADEPSALRARGSHDCNDFLLRHVRPSS